MLRDAVKVTRVTAFFEHYQEFNLGSKRVLWWVSSTILDLSWME
jgi:hypothetical protein